MHLIFINYSSNSQYFDIIVSIIIEKLHTCCRKKPKWGDNMQVMIGKVLPIKLICAGICSGLATGKSFRYFFYQVEARLSAHFKTSWRRHLGWLNTNSAVFLLCVSGLNRAAAHRCCSTVAAGSCCHTGSHTKLPGPTSFPLFPLLFQLLLPLRRLPFVLPSPRCQSVLHAVTPSGLPHIHRHTNKHTSTCSGSPSTLPLLPHHQRQAASYATNSTSAGCFQNKVSSKRQSHISVCFCTAFWLFALINKEYSCCSCECLNPRLLYWQWWSQFFILKNKPFVSWEYPPTNLHFDKSSSLTIVTIATGSSAAPVRDHWRREKLEAKHVDHIVHPLLNNIFHSSRL